MSKEIKSKLCAVEKEDPIEQFLTGLSAEERDSITKSGTMKYTMNYTINYTMNYTMNEMNYITNYIMYYIMN